MFSCILDILSLIVTYSTFDQGEVSKWPHHGWKHALLLNLLLERSVLELLDRPVYSTVICSFCYVLLCILCLLHLQCSVSTVNNSRKFSSWQQVLCYKYQYQYFACKYQYQVQQDCWVSSERTCRFQIPPRSTRSGHPSLVDAMSSTSTVVVTAKAINIQLSSRPGLGLEDIIWRSWPWPQMARSWPRLWIKKSHEELLQSNVCSATVECYVVNNVYITIICLSYATG